MAQRTTIRTNLVGRAIRMKKVPGQVVMQPDESLGVPRELAGKRGEVVSVFLDPDGAPRYTLDIDGGLHEFYGHAFMLLAANEE